MLQIFTDTWLQIQATIQSSVNEKETRLLETSK